MSRRRFEPVFPDHLSDEAASALSEFLHHIAAACDNRYFVQLRRYYSRQRNLYDPDEPWRSPPTDRP
jgi:hypothetical protein